MNNIPSEVTLFKNVTIFDGQNETLLTGYDVLVVENKIKKIGKGIKISDTYELDVKTGGLREVGGGIAHDVQGSGNKVVMVYEPEKMVKKEVQVNVIDGNGRKLRNNKICHSSNLFEGGHRPWQQQFHK